MSSKKASKRKSYHQLARQGDQKYQQLNSERPQDVNAQLMQRTRQLNFGLVSCVANLNEEQITQYEPPSSLWEPKKSYKCYPMGITSPRWVDDDEKFEKMMERLNQCDEIAVDLEMHNYRTMTDCVSLLQIGTWNYGDYLIDPFKVREKITSRLKPLLESTEVLKIAHDLTNDVKWLQKDFDIFMAAAVDTQIMYCLLTGDRQIGFKKLALNYHPELATMFPEETVSDWGLRPGKGMTTEQETYATNDVHVLLRVFDQLRQEMSEKSSDGRLFREAVNLTKGKLLDVSKSLLGGSSTPDFRTILSQELKQMSTHNIRLREEVQSVTEEQTNILVALLEWRHLLAKILDDKPNLLISFVKLFKLCCTAETTIDNIKIIMSGVDKRICDSNSTKCMQAGVIQKLIESKGKYIEELRKLECPNCLRIGHGPAWACPFPKNKENYKAWFNRPENKEFRDKQYNRRLNSLSSKVGAENAVKIISSTKRQ